MLFLLFASLASSLAWVFEFTPLNGAQHALAVVGTLAGAAGLFATYDLPLRSTDIAGLRAAITQAGDLEVQLQARGLLRLKYLVTAVRYKLQRTAADAAVRLDMLLSRLSG